MEKVRDLSLLRGLVGSSRIAGNAIGFVPTMGALHEGHLSLIQQARADCGFVVVSVFVNPLQFSPGEDFRHYPRQREEDAEMLKSVGVDVAYMPDARDFYPPDFSTHVEVAGISQGGEGAVRPGHFRGVTTVVAKLFLQVTPDTAYFGRKDLQQAAVIRQMIRDLDFPIRLVVGEIVRDPDGLAMSTRNLYLSPDERRRAAALPRALFAARERVAQGEQDPGSIEWGTRGELEKGGFTIDYVEVVDVATMRRPRQVEAGVALTAAIRVGKTRLLDNVLLLEKEGESER